MKLHVSKGDNNDCILQWIGKDKRFALWIDEEECDWSFVAKNMDDVDAVSSGIIENEILEKMYEKIGKILGK